MKTFYLIICALCITVCAHSQTKESLQVKTVKVNINLPIVSFALNAFENNKFASATTKKDWIAENWDTTVFNPYKDVKKQYPLHVSFEDSTYASPINRNKVITSRYGWRNRRPHKASQWGPLREHSAICEFSGPKAQVYKLDLPCDVHVWVSKV